MRISTSGVPDVICCYKGRFLALEVKQPDGRLTVLQQRAIRRINRAGGVARRVESVADVQMLVTQVDNEQRVLRLTESQGSSGNAPAKYTETGGLT